MGKLWDWFRGSQRALTHAAVERRTRRFASRRALTVPLIVPMTPWQMGYHDGYKGRANRYFPDADADPYHDPRKVAAQLRAPNTPPTYKAGYREGNADAVAGLPYAEFDRKAQRGH